MRERVGFIGMGIMGVPMTRNLLKAGYPVTIWNRDASKCGALESAGAQTVSTPAELASATDIVILMVTGPEAIDEILPGQTGLLAGNVAGKILINMSTVPPAFSRELSARLKPSGIDFLDAPVSGSRIPAEEGTLIILAGGNKTTVTRLEPLFLSMGKKVVYCGEAGLGSAMKMSINLLLATMMEGLCEAVNLGRKCGLETEVILDTIMAGPMACNYFSLKAGMLMSGEYPPQFPFKHMAKDLRFVLATADTYDARVPLVRANMELFEAGLSSGLSEMDFAAIMKVIEAVK